MKDCLKEIRKILHDNDHEGLIRMGAPSDEYDHEGEMIFERVEKLHTIEEIQKIVYDVFQSQFGFDLNNSFYKIERYLQTAQQIKKAINDE